MKNYEITYLLSPDLSEEETKVLQEKINSLVKEQGGRMSEVTGYIKKRLGYSIKKNLMAFLGGATFELEPEKLESLEKKLKAESGILRYLILTKALPKKVAEVPTKKPKRIVKPKPKVELKEIEKKLEEILGEEK